MKKTISLKELPDRFIDSGLDLSGLSEYLGVSEQTIEEWDKYFNFLPGTGENNEKFYSKKQVDNYIKIKEALEDGKSLKETRDRLFNLSFEIISNPYEGKRNFSNFKPKKEHSKDFSVPEYELRPFLTQLTRVNERMEELLEEKIKIVENTAIEKASLMSKVEILKDKNEALLKEKEEITAYISKKEYEIERSFSREENLARTLKLSQELLNKKEEEIYNLRGKIEEYQEQLENKEAFIYDQSEEIDRLLEKQKVKWWQFWK